MSADHQFLFPFSILSGVGVNLFFFLSGYGIAFSQIKKGGTVLEFFTHRLIKLLVPFWIVLCTVFLLDAVLLQKTYDVAYTVRAFFGVFISADLFTDVNSPMWYFTLILMYYILFRLFFIRKLPHVTALILYLIVWGIVQLNPPFLSGVIGLYEVHLFAFPLGILAAWLMNMNHTSLDASKAMYETHKHTLYPFIVSALSVFIGYFAIHSSVGGSANLEQVVSLSMSFAIILFFIIKVRESKLFSIFGLYSYEIYLFHWPLLYRYDFLYRHFPIWIATVLYLVLFVLLAIVLRYVTTYVFHVLRRQ